MTNTMQMNGSARKTLASQLDRLDSILDGLSEGLSDAVASAVREAVGQAVHEAVQAVLTELLTNPALREQLQKAASPAGYSGRAKTCAGLQGPPGWRRIVRMHPRDRTRLLFGHYRPPRLRKGDRAACLYRDC